MDGYLLICTYFQMKMKYQEIKKKITCHIYIQHQGTDYAS